MNGIRLLLGFAVLALTMGSAAMASEIYKWTDENGNVHYGDRPSGSATEQRMALSYHRTDTGALQTLIQSRRLYRQDENGERVYLDEKDIQESRARIEEFISENCTS